MATTDQKKLKAFLKRRHPEFKDARPHWEFLQHTYQGGRDWFNSGNIFRYMKEGDKEYKDRVARAYRFNHTREVVDLVDKHLFKLEISRSEDAPDGVKEFWKSSTRNGLSIKEYAKRASNLSSQNGRVWAVVDSSRDASVIKTRADEKKAKVKVYSYLVLPQFVLDMGYTEQGDLSWILIQENVRDDDDPIESSGKIEARYRLWTTEFSQLFEVDGDLEKKEDRAKVIVHPEIRHGLGLVPVIPVDNVISDELYTSPAMIADVAYLDRAIANYLSNMDAIIQDQTFSQLAIPAQGLMPGTSDDEGKLKKMIEFGTKRIFTYNGEGNAKPEYLSPDVKQAELILKVVNKIIGEIYHSIGLAGERTKDDNSQGIDNSSGVAKAYDFERVNSLLTSKADSLEQFENRLAFVVAKWRGEEKAVEKLKTPLVSYPDNFDVRGLYDEFEIAARLSLIEAPEGTRRQQMNTVIDKLFPQLKAELIEKLKAELKDWPKDPVEMAREMAIAGAAGDVDTGNQTAKDAKKDGKNSLSNKLVKGKSGKQ